MPVWCIRRCIHRSIRDTIRVVMLRIVKLTAGVGTAVVTAGLADCGLGSRPGAVQVQSKRSDEVLPQPVLTRDVDCDFEKQHAGCENLRYFSKLVVFRTAW